MSFAISVLFMLTNFLDFFWTEYYGLLFLIFQNIYINTIILCLFSHACSPLSHLILVYTTSKLLAVFGLPFSLRRQFEKKNLLFIMGGLKFVKWFSFQLTYDIIIRYFCWLNRIFVCHFCVWCFEIVYACCWFFFIQCIFCVH